MYIYIHEYINVYIHTYSYIYYTYTNIYKYLHMYEQTCQPQSNSLVPRRWTIHTGSHSMTCGRRGSLEQLILNS